MILRMVSRMALLLCIFGTAAFAGESVTKINEALVKKAVEAKFPGINVSSVTKTPYGGLYEVAIDSELFYTDERVNFMFLGSIIDTKSMMNVTEERLRNLMAIKFDTLPLDLAVKIERGNGKRKFAYFADPNCGFCKKFEKDIAKVTNVTIYTFLYPVLSPDSVQKAKAVWCSEDRVKAWNDLMLNGTDPSATKGCENPVEKITQLGRRLRITGTPTLIFENGRVVAGAIPAAQLEKQLDAASAK